MKDNYDISALKPKKKKVNSRSKGNTFERDIAKKLNTRFNTTEFSRTPGSGAFATTHALPDHLQIYGDLITPKNFKFCIECKKGYNKENLYSLYNYSSDTWKFIEQCQKDSRKCGLLPLVIFKQDRQKILAIAPSNSVVFTSDKFITIHKRDVPFVEYYNIYLLDDILKEPTDCWFDL
jgi:Holliday junction resolvase